LRLETTSSPIVLQKVDFKSAYRRQHLSADTAIQCLSSVNVDDIKYILINLRLTFGGSACPSEWCIISETITDTANRILNDAYWDPNSLSPKISKIIPKTHLLDPTIPFAKAKPLLVNIPLEPIGQSDVYIDDICTVGILDSKQNEEKLRKSILLAMETIGRPLNMNEKITRDDLPSIDKLLSEAGLSEQKCLLGWILDTRRLRISLHMEKYTYWRNQIQDLLHTRGRTTKKILETTLG
jgi:hypothetical protein